MIPNPYEQLITQYATLRGFEPDLIARQIEQESGFRERVVSSCGAIGLMQVTPAAATEVRMEPVKLTNPEMNIIAGTAYLQLQFRRFPEIPDRDERLKFSLAAYNCGRGYINRALWLNSRKLTGSRFPPVWDLVKIYLRDSDCQVNGMMADAAQVVLYVWKIWQNFERDRALRHAQEFEWDTAVVG